MGAQLGKEDQNRPVLTEAELLQLKSTFDTIKAFQHSGKHGADAQHSNACRTDVFQSFCCRSLDEFLSQQIAAIIEVGSRSKEPNTITFQAFQHFVSTALKGEFDQKVQCIFFMCSVPPVSPSSFSAHTTITGSSILKLTASIVTSYVWHSFQDTPGLKSWSNCLTATSQESRGIQLATYLLHDLLYPAGLPKDLITKQEDFGSRQFTLDELITGLAKSSLFQTLFNSVISNCFKFDMDVNVVTKNKVPQCLQVNPTLLPTNFTMLSQESVMFLNSLLPPELQSKWRFLFSSMAHGESFSKLLERIQEKGATIIIVKDQHDRIFGCFAPSSWKLGPKFFGTSRSFLFHLAPRFAPYGTTPYNENFQYLNMGQKTLPNGLGMGGTLEYFGLWLDSEYGKGICSPSCTTYTCPQLSVEKEFTINRLEAWGVGPEPEKEEGVRDPKNISILDKDPELRGVLEVMGKKVSASDGYRDVDPIEIE